MHRGIEAHAQQPSPEEWSHGGHFSSTYTSQLILRIFNLNLKMCIDLNLIQGFGVWRIEI
jgi:hypothetical protein